MKIIAKASGSWLVECSETDIANLIGKQYIFRGEGLQPAVGVSFEINEMYEHLVTLDSARKEILKYQERLLQCATLLDLPVAIKTQE